VFFIVIDNLVIRCDFEDTAVIGNQAGIQIETTFNGGRQTGGLRKIISFAAIADADLEMINAGH
jgi:hypothetical protein